MLRKVGIAQKKRVFDFDFWIIGGIFMKKFVAGVVALTIAFGGMALPAESGVFFDGAAVSASAETYGDYEYKVLDNGTVEITKYSGTDEKVVVPSTINGKKVTSIGKSAFFYCTSLTSIAIPNSVTSIGESAFYECKSLTSITLPNTITSIGKSIFSDCENLKSITIPESVTSIGEYAFSGCASLTSIKIPDSVTSISDWAFTTCTGLTSVTIGNGVTSIGGAAFNGCTGLTSVTIPNSVKIIGMNAFAGCVSVKSVTIGNNVASIESGAFTSCKSLTNVTIPDSVTSVASAAFIDCTSLTNITVGSKNKNYSSENGILFNKDKTELCVYPAGNSRKEYKISNNVTSIADHAFSYCSNLTNVSIPNSVTNIGNSAFSGCERLSDITIPNGITSISELTFDNCKSLTNITIPESVTNIGTNAFSNCTSLTSVKMPSKLTVIGPAAFSNCSSLKNITIPSGVTGIDTYTFRECTSLTEISFPNTVTYFGFESFWGCKDLKKVTIPKSVVDIGHSAFANCPSIKDVYYKGSKADWKKITVQEFNDSLVNATIHYTPDELTVDKVKTTKFTCTDKAVKINWEKVDGAAGYRVYAYNTKAKKWSTAATVSASTLSFKQTGLKSGTTYKYKVKAYAKQDGKTYWGEASDTMTTTTKPAQPAIKSTSASTSAVRLNWNAVSGANGYRVVRYDANAKKWASVGTIKTTSFKETKLKGKTSYKYKVKAYRKVGGATYWSDYSAVKSVKTK